MSTGLSDDARSAYQRLRRRARTLGSISSSFDALAVSLTAAYHAALTHSDSAAWTELVRRAALLAQRAHAFDGIVVLDGDEREALEFFEAIVHENADLLVAPEALASGSNPGWQLQGASA